MNTITVSLFRRPLHTRLCLESLCRAQRWHPWASYIAVCLPSIEKNAAVEAEAFGVKERNPDIDIRIWIEPSTVGDPHQASKWMLDTAFGQGSDCNLYVEDDVIVSPD